MYQRYGLFEELIQKSSYPTSKHLKKYYDESTKQVQTLDDEYSEVFYYDKLIKVSSKCFDTLKDSIGHLILDKMKEYSLEDIKLIPKEYKIIMQEISKRSSKTITAYELKDLLGKSPKQIERYFENLMSEFHNLIELKAGRKKAYKLIDNFDVFIEAFKNKEEFDELFYLAQESNPELFKKLEFSFNKNKDDVFMFKNTIFETVRNQEIFNNLKIAIKANEYRIIKLKNVKEQEVKCIKLVFVDNNWYLAYVDSCDALRLARVSFIELVKYASKNSFQKSSIKKYLNDLETKLQNAMTRFDKEQQIATIKATSQVAKYFEKDMKKFLPSQEFREKLDDGSVIFTVSYTQSLEILPFVQKWLPDLIILEPRELKEQYRKKIQQIFKNLN
jgi:predicted DNA-binding transcriptional regulator YafY